MKVVYFVGPLPMKNPDNETGENIWPSCLICRKHNALVMHINRCCHTFERKTFLCTNNIDVGTQFIKCKFERHQFNLTNLDFTP